MNKRDITYFNYCGEVNTADLLQLARQRSEIINIQKVVIASETGLSALKALETFKDTNLQLIVVTHYPATTWGPI
jgi:hypothetical protein